MSPAATVPRNARVRSDRPPARDTDAPHARAQEKLAREMAATAQRLSLIALTHLQREHPTLVRLHKHCGRHLEASRFAPELSLSIACETVALRWWSQEVGPHNSACPALLIPTVEELIDELTPSRSSRDLIDSLRHVLLLAETHAVQLASFETHSLDPYIEALLQAFDPAARRANGVFFSPSAVVTFLVESVDQLLRRELELPDGLADVSSWRKVLSRRPNLTLPVGVSLDDPFVQVLDPATGTGAFLTAIIDRVYRTLCERWSAQRLDATAQQERWATYVRAHLLPRLHGFELLLAPHTVAAIALASKLRATGYRLTNSDVLSLWHTDALDRVDESIASEHDRKGEHLRSQVPITVLIGNPPYAGATCAPGPWIESLMEDYKVTVRAEERQIQRLSNLYIRFLRLVEWKAAQSGIAAVGLVTDRGYFDGVLYRDVRKSLLAHAASLYLVDLGGSTSRQQACTLDDNVFNIQQAVALTVGVLQPSQTQHPCCVRLAKVEGSRGTKLSWLRDNSIETTAFHAVSPKAPLYRLRRALDSTHDYHRWPSLLDLIGTGDPQGDRKLWHGTGIKTRHDPFVVAMSVQAAIRQVQQLAHSRASNQDLIDSLHLCRTAHFDIEAARIVAELPSNELRSMVQPLSFRPMDRRYVVMCRQFICEPKARTMRHMSHPNNVALATLRRDRTDRGAGVCVARGGVAKDYVSNLDDALIWPVYVACDKGWRANLAPRFIEQFCETTGLNFQTHAEPGPLMGRREQVVGALSSTSFDAYDMLGYFYAVLHSSQYRSSQREALCLDFPRIPTTPSASLFWQLSSIGKTLVSLHLLDQPSSSSFPTSIRRGSRVESVRYDERLERVFIDATQSLPVPRDAWDYVIGAHQVCKAWLTARRGHRLRASDILHLHNMVQSIGEVLALVARIDPVIEQHGGWVSAFQPGGTTQLNA